MSSGRLLIVCLAGGLLAACRETTAPPSDVGVPYAAEPLTALVSSNTWRARAPLRGGRAFVGAAAGGGFLYVVGGLRSGPGGEALRTASLQVYNLTTNTWSMRKALPLATAYNIASFINGKLYTTGGFGDYGRRLFVYDPAADVWTRKADVPTILTYGVQGVINGKLYVYSESFYRYDPGTNKWTKLATPVVPARAAAAGVIGGRLYVAGGEDQSSAPVTDVNVYDPATNRWQSKAPMPVALTFTASAVINGKLYVAGGGTCGSCGPLQTLLVYDPVTDKWTTKASMPTARAAAAGVSAGGKFYVLGGWNSSNISQATVEAYTP